MKKKTIVPIVPQRIPVGGWHTGQFNYGNLIVNLYSYNKKEIAANPHHVYNMFAKMGISPNPGIYNNEEHKTVMIVSIKRD